MRFLSRGLLVSSLIFATAQFGFANCASDDPTGSKRAQARSDIAMSCDCATATSHGAYVSCVASHANTEVTNGVLPVSCKGAVKRCAAHSTCGKPGAVTCCVTTHSGTKCKIKKDATHCTAKQGTVGACTSCCDACPAPGSGPSCPATTTTTTTPTLPITTTTAAGGTTTTTVAGGTTTTTLPSAGCGTVPMCGGSGCGTGMVCSLVLNPTTMQEGCSCASGTAECSPTSTMCSAGACPSGTTCQSNPGPGGGCACF